jgi:hypothetical protein
MRSRTTPASPRRSAPRHQVGEPTTRLWRAGWASRTLNCPCRLISNHRRPGRFLTSVSNQTTARYPAIPAGALRVGTRHAALADGRRAVSSRPRLAVAGPHGRSRGLALAAVGGPVTRRVPQAVVLGEGVLPSAAGRNEGIAFGLYARWSPNVNLRLASRSSVTRAT